MRVKTFYRILRIVSAIVLFFFVWTFGEVWQSVAWAVTPNQAKTQRARSEKPRPASTEERFETELDGLRVQIGKAGEKAARGEDIAQNLEGVKAGENALEAQDAALRKQFADTEKTLIDKKLPKEILERHRKFVAQYEADYKELKDHLARIEQAGTQAEKIAAIKKASDFLARVKRPSLHKKLDPENLPFRARKAAKMRAPRTREQFERDFPKQTLQSKKKIADSRSWHNLLASAPKQKLIQLAFNETASDVPFSLGAQPSTPELAFNGSAPFLIAQATDQPSSDDLSETPDIQFTDAIRAKAQELGNNPVKIYEWVRNNIEYAPTYGSIQGADMCLQTQQCNDMDTASLLIALFRASNISARYVYGTIEVPIDKVMNWVGNFSDPVAAATFIASGGVPGNLVYSGGAPTSVRMEHVWVEANVPYGPYSGRASNLTADSIWVPLDPSFKQYTYTDGLDFQSAVPFDAQSFANQIQSTATINQTDGSVTNVDSSYIQTTLTNYQTQVQNYISQNMPNATVGDIIGNKEIKKQEFGILPVTLPYKVIMVGTKYSEVPDNLRYKVTIAIFDPQAQTQSFTNTFSTAYLAGKRITVAYMPATQADAQTLQNYGYYNTPPYLVNLKPVLNIDGTAVSLGGSAGMGMAQNLSVTFTMPDGSTDMVTHEISASSYAALGLDLQSETKSILDQRNADLNNAVNQLGQQNVDVDDIIGETLNLHNLGYFRQLEVTNRMSATGKVAFSMQPAEMLTTLLPSINYLYGVPYSVTALGTKVDVKRYLMNVVSLKGNSLDEKVFMNTAGANSSAYEHTIIEELHQDAEGVSAVKILSIANQQGIPIYTIDSTNSATLLPMLQISADTMSDIQNAIAAGKQVIIPERTIQYYDWSGEGYIIKDPVTGSGAYMITGGLAGGGTTQKEEALCDSMGQLLTAIGFSSDLMNSFVDLIKYLGKIMPSGVSSILGAFGNVTAVFAALNDSYNMYLKTNCAWNAGASAATSLAISMWAGAEITAAIGAIVATTLLAAFVIALAIVLLIALLSILINYLVQQLIALKSWCINFIRKNYFSSSHYRVRERLV